MTDSLKPADPDQRQVVKHYERGLEAERLSGGTSRLEFARTRELLSRFLPPPPARVVDVGGGPGAYSCWLAGQGYEAHLVDIVPLHVEQARRASDAQPGSPIASATVGDARSLDREDASADVVLLLGPLYHLIERDDRVKALAEARRVLVEGGVVFAVGISRFASLLDGLRLGFLDDPEFRRAVESDLKDGQHRNPGDHPDYFTTAFFHRPEELQSEVEQSGLVHEGMFAIEGPGWLLQDFNDRWKDDARREGLLNAIRLIEQEPSLVGASAHLLAVARKI
jgi:ubiquinone/menaquinone biosynthesis C-methylase UbiE